jgi:hypothetical protein
MVVVWPMLTEWVVPDDVLEEPPPATSTTITTMGWRRRPARLHQQSPSRGLVIDGR